MKRWIRGMLAGVLAGGLLAGCATAPQQDPCSGFLVDPPAEAGFKMNSVKIIDRSLLSESVWVTYCRGQRVGPPPEVPPEKFVRYKISVEQHNSRKTPTGTLEVWAVLKNHTDFPLQIEGRTQYFGPGLAPVDVPTAWKRVHLPPKGIATYREFSTQTDGIEGYYVEIREGR